MNKDTLATEQSSNYSNLEHMSTLDLLRGINNEDKTVPHVIAEAIPRIEAFVNVTVDRMKSGGRLFYIGAGTSGRLGVLDASECPPTFGVTDDYIIGLIAGGDIALRKAVENAEDNPKQAWNDLQEFNIDEKDTLLGIAASGTTPYVIGGLKKASENTIVTGCITCNKDSPLAEVADFPMELVVGPEFVTGSTRMKAGTAQKLVLNMISTSIMIKLGRVRGNKMVDMQLSNKKLEKRATRMLIDELGIELSEASKLLKKHKNVRKAIDAYKTSN